MGKEDRRTNSRRALFIAALLAALLGFAAVALYLRGGGSGPERSQPAASTAEDAPTAAGAGSARQPETTATRPAAPQPTADEATTFFDQLLAEEKAQQATPSSNAPRNLWATVANVTIRLTLAALLAAMLAFRPRRFALLFKRNLFVAQTQILLAVVASALMMIVGDSAARAFGIFAAVSLVRFRTNIKDPKEITVLLVSLGIGLATGVGRWELAMVLAFFVLLLLWALEYRESELIFRSMELTVKTRDVDATQGILLGLFRKYNFSSEIRQLDRPDGDAEVGCIVYNVEMSPLISTDRMSNEILTADPQNIDSVEWDQQKSAARFIQ